MDHRYDRFARYEDAGLGAEEFEQIRRFTRSTEKTPVRTDRPPPMLGQHTDEVLGELLGVDAARLATLRDRQVI